MVSLLIFVIQLYLFGAIAIGLHYTSARIGLSPLLFMVAGIIGILNIIELNSLVITLNDDIVLRPGGHVLVPASLMIILLLYVVHGTRPAQIAVLGIAGVNFLVFTTLSFTALYTEFFSVNTIVEGIFTDSTVFNLFFIRQMVASQFAFTADMLIMIIVYQGINNYMKWIPKAIIPGIALVIALWTDTAIFNIGGLAGTPYFSFAVPSDLLMKTSAGMLLLPLIGWYLTKIAPHMPQFVGSENRRTLSILFRDGHRDLRVETLESELRVSRSVYNQLTQHIREIFWLIDLEQQRFLYVSPAYEEITQYSVEPLYQNINHLLEILHKEDREYTEGDILNFLVSSRDTEFRIVRPDNSIRTLRARSFPIKDDLGNVIRYAGIAEDITEQKKMTDQAFQLALAQERMQILNDFIRDASHDLKTPISSMILKISLLDRIEDEARRAEIRGELRGRAMHLSDLITDLFTLSRIEGYEQIDFEPISINDIVLGVIQDTKALADEKGLELTSALAPENIKIEGNYDQIHRVVSNLVSNAIRYTDAGDITVITTQENDMVTLRVKDTGMGIPAESVDRVFDRFFRTTEAKDTKEGTGLGLAIAKAIIECHHGTIHVESVEAEGSIFIVHLPLTQPEKETSVDIRRSTQEIRAIPMDS